VVDLPFGATELVASWNARTPPGTWLEVEAAVTTSDGATSGWLPWATWAETDVDVLPASAPDPGAEHVTVDVDIIRARPGRALASYQLRVRLLDSGDAGAPARLMFAAMMASRVEPSQASPSTQRRAVLVDVPAHSQQLHRGRYPQWDGGGASWCSPTATSMVLAHWGHGPAAEDYAWVDDEAPDRFVAHAARHTFDHAYGGAGNWSFNMAYAARFGVRAFVTRLRDLTEAERFLAAGIPLVVSVSFAAGELAGAGYETAGHLLAVVGIDDAGDVVCNDPASHGVAANDQVRVTYDRGQLERAWLGGSGGVAYVMHPPDVALPEPPADEPNW
jgi:hypothetical protein